MKQIATNYAVPIHRKVNEVNLCPDETKYFSF